MSQQQLRFSVEESVWFQKGQEVSELLSISLDPDIAIHEHDQYISIRGALQLTGEYKIETESSEEETFEYANVRYVNEVDTREDGVSVLNHRFPVDITIPKNRIQQLDEVYVSIESFDYDLPEHACLKLIADLSISGISNGETAEEEEVRPAEEPKEEAFEALFREEQNTAEHNNSEPVSRIEPSPFSSFYEERKLDEEDVDKLSPSFSVTKEQDVVEEREEEAEEVVVETSPAEYEKEIVEPEPAVVEEVNVEQGQTEEEVYDPFVVEVRREESTPEPQEVQYSFFSKTEEEPTNVDEDLQKKDEVGREEGETKDAHYLTSLFARDEEEDFSRVKMCIVQQGDTLELISEKYEISIQQILRVNEFHADQDVYEGQILYIPAYSTSK
ncbi:stage VI sporulation protein D [Metabacillus endolithicus]|uniref:Stage VI sporulation protein D n=1 Tax=Metabacillus endolithicus TaxID=1535204 RepID=A0ABW5BVF5_9BACI|nr:stage VI sporulation protein D [Metabacillus endolithicus]UPG64713.1 stage VI sporulation protein D [Metabacillus endolithicus]